MTRLLRQALLVAVASSTALAQPKPKQPGPQQPAGDKDRNDAKALLASGLKLFQAKDYLGALVVFRDAYARFASAKILLNIATTLKQLSRNAEAANTYQRYLDAQDSDPTKKADVSKVLAELDAKVGLVELTVKPTDAEVQFAGEDQWHPAADVAHYRVEPGKVTIRARRDKPSDSGTTDKFTPAEKSVDASAGKRVAVALALEAIPEATVATVVTPPTGDGIEDNRDGGESSRSQSRFGAYALAHIDIAHSGGAARVGATVELIPRLQAELGAIIGPSSGGYAGARYAFLPGRFRPVLSVGMPIFIEDGAHVALRGAAGLEVVLSPHISIVAEAGVERVLNAGMNYVETMFVPAVGAAGRL